ncbi:hypothetical protein [Pedobacter flavus]|uniref:Uncharacterized protein n=1 Tax=Pedobacter flavus TaxID=3113906 RepID=A0ABU7H4K4_9SPHI|nr:hypothetical protein [Pedobacter sp. VNH31]MEE1885977.1 hypothetical protein [Pedobacter sp. VNH31]
MKIRVTPLNFIAAALLVFAVLLLFDQIQLFSIGVPAMKILFVVLFLVAAIVAFISDLIFRKMIPSIKRLWLIELSLITLTAVIVLILKSILP